MNRRHFLAAVSATPLGISATSIREERQALTIAGSVRAHVIVSAHAGEKSAERFRARWIGEPFEAFGEFYRDSTEFRDLPEDVSKMPATLTFHNTTIGVAAEKRDYLVGTFRRETITVIVRIIGDHENVMLAIAEHLTNQEVPTPFEILWNPVHLRKFIPGSEELGMSVVEVDSYWP